MGNNSENGDKVLVQGLGVEANNTEDVWNYVPTSEGEIFGVKVSIEVCCQVSLEDRRCDLLRDFEEALFKTMVGYYGLTPRLHITEYKGTLWLADPNSMEGT